METFKERRFRETNDAYNYKTKILGKEIDESDHYVLHIKKIIEKTKNFPSKIDSPKAKGLIFSLQGWVPHIIREAILSHAFAWRNVETKIITCGTNYPMCVVKKSSMDVNTACDLCNTRSELVFNNFNLQMEPLDINENDLIQAKKVLNKIPETFKDFKSFIFKDLPLGELVYLSLIQYFYRYRLEETPSTMKVFKDLLKTSIVLVSKYNTLLDSYKPDFVLAFNGMTFTESILLEICKRKNIVIYTHEMGHLKNTICFTKNEMVSKRLLDRIWDNEKDLSLTNEETVFIKEIFDNYSKGDLYQVDYWKESIKDIENIRANLHLDTDKKIITLFTNVCWDTTVMYKDSIFNDQYEWIKAVINYISNKSEYHLLLRIHPCESFFSNKFSMETIKEYIINEFPILPPNISLISSESSINSYSIIDLSDLILVYNSNIGYESVIKGKPTLTAANNHYVNKDFTFDADSKKEYFNMLENLLKNDFIINKKLALRYLYFYYLQFSIHFPFIKDGKDIGEVLNIDLPNIEYLQEGNNPYIDFMCDSIINQKEIVLPKEFQLNNLIF